MLEHLLEFFNHAELSLVLAMIVALGIGAQWLAWYLKQPSIIFLLAIGLIIGPLPAYLGVEGLTGFRPDVVLGDLLFPFISLGVAIILFEGSLTLQFHELKNHGKVVQHLVSVGVLITIALITLFAYLLFDMSLTIALLFGALVCVTGPTVILPILRSVRPSQNVSNVLKWEGIIIDPIGAIAVVLVYEFINMGATNVGSPILVFGKIIISSALIGVAAAWLLATLIKRHLIPEYLRNVFTLAFVLLMFALSNQLEHESGLLTVTVMGVALANWPGFPKDDLLDFNESLSVLLISVLFIVLAARVEIPSLLAVGVPGILLLLLVMFVARPAAVFASAYNSKLSVNEKLMISWIGPRGIVAAAISSLFAIRLQDPQFAQMGLRGVELLVPLVFLVIAGTVVIQSLGAKVVANLLGLREPANNGVLIVGSNPVALTVAKALKAQNIEVVMAHSNYTNIAKARMEGIRSYFGNPVSEHAERQLDLVGLGHMFAMSVDQELNALSEMHYRHEFGGDNVYRLRYAQEKSQADRDKNQSSYQSKWLFGSDVSHAKLASMISKNARAKVTKITEAYSFAQYRADNPTFIPLFYIDSKNKVQVVTATNAAKIPEDVRLVSLVAEDNPNDSKGLKSTDQSVKKAVHKKAEKQAKAEAKLAKEQKQQEDKQALAESNQAAQSTAQPEDAQKPNALKETAQTEPSTAEAKPNPASSAAQGEPEPLSQAKLRSASTEELKAAKSKTVGSKSAAAVVSSAATPAPSQAMQEQDRAAEGAQELESESSLSRQSSAKLAGETEDLTQSELQDQRESDQSGAGAFESAKGQSQAGGRAETTLNGNEEAKSATKAPSSQSEPAQDSSAHQQPTADSNEVKTDLDLSKPDPELQDASESLDTNPLAVQTAKTAETKSSEPTNSDSADKPKSKAALASVSAFPKKSD